jgi:hypothetical protein
MGMMTAIGIAETELSLEQQLGWHLTGNHYPPIPKVMVTPCMEAIEAYHDGDLDRLIPLPFDGVDRNGEPFQIRWRNGATEAPARALIEHANLYAWCVEVDEY